MGHASINALAKHLHRQYRNVFDDVKTMEKLGLVEKDQSGHFYVPWDEIAMCLGTKLTRRSDW